MVGDNEFKIIASNEKIQWTRMIFLFELASTIGHAPGDFNEGVLMADKNSLRLENIFPTMLALFE
jgi:hypothetical protein